MGTRDRRRIVARWVTRSRAPAPGVGEWRPQPRLSSDWIFTGMNIGSFEGAVMSGSLAAHAATGVPRLGGIVGCDVARPDGGRS